MEHHTPLWTIDVLTDGPSLVVTHTIMASYDAYGRPHRGSVDNDYYEGANTNTNSNSDFSHSSYHTEPRENPERRRESSNTGKRTSPSRKKMGTSDGYFEPATNDVSPELIAALTERITQKVKKERE